MRDSSFKKILGVLLVCFVMITAIGFIWKSKKEKTAKLEENTTTEVVRIGVNPIEKMNAATYSKTRITCSSQEILKYIANKVPDDTWVPFGEISDPVKRQAEINNRKATHKISGGYYIEIPSYYFSSNSCRNITEFNFSGLNCGAIKILPDFSNWPNLKRLNFSKCQITDVSGFTKSSYLKRITYIDLSYNHIKDLDTGIVKDSRFNLRNQHYRNRCCKSKKGRQINM